MWRGWGAVANNAVTMHFQKLLVHVVRLAAAARKHEGRALAATNALVLTRAVVLYATERMGASDLAVLVHTPPAFLLEASASSREAVTGAALQGQTHWRPCGSA